MITEPFGYTIFADDIRLEASGKLIMVGVYNSFMLINPAVSFPLSYEKLALDVHAIIPKNISPDKITLMVYFPGDLDESPTLKQDFPLVGGAIDLTDGITLDQKVGRFQTQIMFAPLNIREPGILKVRGIVEEKLFPMGSLIIRHPPTQVETQDNAGAATPDPTILSPG